jgi:tetratricopeptide (TPR) repeat protein
MSARVARALLPVLLLGLSLAGAPGALAAEGEEKAAQGEKSVAEDGKQLNLEELATERQLRAAQYRVNPRISRYLGAAAEALDQDDPDAAMALLSKLNPKRLNPYERALLYRLMGYVAYSAGKHEQTIEYFEKVLAEEVLPLDAETGVRFSIAQLHGALQQWDKVISSLQTWFQYVENPNPLAYYLIGLSYYQLEKPALAIENTRKAIELSESPAEGWLQLLAALYIQGEDYAKAEPVLEQLVIRFPKKLYWVQLSLIYGAREDYDHSLAAQQVAYLQGLLTDDKELRRLARSYVYNGLPYPAAHVLEKGLKDGTVEKDADVYELLANSWIAAREYERSLPPLREAAERSDDGKLFLRIGQVHLQREEWDAAAENLQHGLEKGGLDSPGSAHLLLGIAHYNAKRVEAARASFQLAHKYEPTRAEADRWIEHLAEGDQQG